MGFAPLYLLNRFFFRLTDFFHHWYLSGSRAIGRRFVVFLEDMDSVLALRATARNFFRPLYGDYSGVGRVLGVVFRTGRILIALLLYIFCTLLFAVMYAAWLLLPFIPLYMAYRDLLA